MDRFAIQDSAVKAFRWVKWKMLLNVVMACLMTGYVIAFLPYENDFTRDALDRLGTSFSPDWVDPAATLSYVYGYDSVVHLIENSFDEWNAFDTDELVSWSHRTPLVMTVRYADSEKTFRNVRDEVDVHLTSRTIACTLTFENPLGPLTRVANLSHLHTASGLGPDTTDTTPTPPADAADELPATGSSPSAWDGGRFASRRAFGRAAGRAPRAGRTRRASNSSIASRAALGGATPPEGSIAAATSRVGREGGVLQAGGGVAGGSVLQGGGEEEEEPLECRGVPDMAWRVEHIKLSFFIRNEEGGNSGGEDLCHDWSVAQHFTFLHVGVVKFALDIDETLCKRGSSDLDPYATGKTDFTQLDHVLVAVMVFTLISFLTKTVALRDVRRFKKDQKQQQKVLKRQNTQLLSLPRTRIRPASFTAGGTNQSFSFGGGGGNVGGLDSFRDDPADQENVTNMGGAAAAGEGSVRQRINFSAVETFVFPQGAFDADSCETVSDSTESTTSSARREEFYADMLGEVDTTVGVGGNMTEGYSWIAAGLAADALCLIWVVLKWTNRYSVHSTATLTATRACLAMGAFGQCVTLMAHLGDQPWFYLLSHSLQYGVPGAARHAAGCLPLYFGYAFVATYAFGPYCSSFQSLDISCVSLFAVMNGDVVHDMFTKLYPISPGFLQVYSRMFLYSFIIMFIYVILNIFLAIMEDTYWQIKQSLVLDLQDDLKKDAPQPDSPAGSGGASPGATPGTAFPGTPHSPTPSATRTSGEVPAGGNSSPEPGQRASAATAAGGQDGLVLAS